MGEFTDSDIEAKGDQDVLARKIHHQYGVTKEEAQRQTDDWLSKT